MVVRNECVCVRVSVNTHLQKDGHRRREKEKRIKSSEDKNDCLGLQLNGKGKDVFIV